MEQALRREVGAEELDHPSTGVGFVASASECWDGFPGRLPGEPAHDPPRAFGAGQALGGMTGPV